MSRAVVRAISDVITASDRLYQAARASRRVDAELGAILITAIAASIRADRVDVAAARRMILEVAEWQREDAR
jgi:hypothetical protein